MNLIYKKNGWKTYMTIDTRGTCFLKQNNGWNTCWDCPWNKECPRSDQ